jgi:hypothetical protein
MPNILIITYIPSFVPLKDFRSKYFCSKTFIKETENKLAKMHKAYRATIPAAGLYLRPYHWVNLNAGSVGKNASENVN